jgi:hypothetical protein
MAISLRLDCPVFGAFLWLAGEVAGAVMGRVKTGYVKVENNKTVSHFHTATAAAG